MIDGLFDFNLENGYKISVTPNEVYNQLLLYIFFKLKKNIIIVTPSLNEANKVYSCLKLNNDKVFLFPDDDYLTKKAIAVSPELMYVRMKFLNNIISEENNIVVCHTNSFLKKLPNKNYFKDLKILLNIGKKIDRDYLVKRLNDIGYKRESIVTNTGDFSVRGFVIDIFPIFEEKPIRIEFFDDEIESIKTFDENTQLSLNQYEEFVVKPVVDEYNNCNSSIVDYFNEPVIIYQDYLQIKNIEKSIIEQMEYYEDSNSIFQLSQIKSNYNIFIDTINNDSSNLLIEAQSIIGYSNNKAKFLNDINLYKSYLCTNDTNFADKLGVDKSIVIKANILEGFIYNGIYYFSKNDLYPLKKSLSYESGAKFGKKLNSLEKLEIGDYVVHKVNGIGVYMGIKTISKNGIDKDYIMIKYKGEDKLYLSVDNLDKLYKYSSKDGAKPVIHKLNSLEWQKTKQKIRNRIKDISDALIKIYKNRSISTIEPFEKDSPEQLLFEQEFIYDETPDQLRSTLEIKKDLESSKPMDRLLCGDVGYGKTEVIFRAMFKTIMNSKQVMYLCPTTLLSHQQYNSCVNRFENYGVNIAVLNRYTTKREAGVILSKLLEGKIDILFGTHRLLSKDVIFKDLGLLVIDEEQQFGVMHKDKIKEIKSNVHVLSVSATPIPRSLQMSLVGIRDLSLIETPPKNKIPVQTYVINYDEYIIRDVIIKEKTRNGQVFVLYNKVETIERFTNKLRSLVPSVTFNYAHGKMNKEDMQDIMYNFNNNEFDVLVSTTIIENGIDIPNANTIIIIDADKFGLAQLYQIRGRVGRADRQAYAFLMYDKNKILSETAIKRLDAIKEFTQLGSGYKISMRDLSIRGAGDLLGSEQAGFIDSVGVDMYFDLVNEVMNGVEKELEIKEEIKIDDVSTHIGSEYTEDDSIIIEIHKKVCNIKTKEDLDILKEEITDRFGRIDEKLLIYMYQELTEKIIERLSLRIMLNDSHKFILKINKNIYEKINIEELFMDVLKLSSKFSFAYKNESIHISLNKLGLDKHYIYYLFELLNYIEKRYI